MLNASFFPILAASAFKNKGVQTLLDAVVDYLPSPVDRPAIKGTDMKGNEISRKSADNEPLSMLAFKIMDDPFGILTFARIYSGKLEKGMALSNSTRERSERAGRMVLMHANNREEISEAYAGDIVALIGLKDTRTGDHALRPEPSGRSRAHGVPGSCHRDGRRAQDEGRPGEDGDRSRQAGR